MSCISFSDLGMICRHFNLNTGEVFELLSTPQRTLIARASAPIHSIKGAAQAAVRGSVTAVSDSASEASSVAPAKQFKFASSKTADFAKEMCEEHGISMESITPTGKGGKITKDDVKKALPAKKRGRKRKGSSGKDGDMVDKLKTKDPNAPKRPGNAWLLFLNAHRAAKVSENPSMKMPEITKLISVDYKALSAEEKKVWTDQYEAAKAKYAADMAAYKASKESDAASVVSKASTASKTSKVSATSGLKLAAEETTALKKVKIPKEHKAAVREELKKLQDGNWTNEQKLAALKSVVAAKKLAKDAEKRAQKAAKIQTKVDDAVKEILSYVTLNKLNAADEKSLRNRVKDVDEHCQGSLLDGVTLKEMKSILKEQKALNSKLAKAAAKPKKAVIVGPAGGAAGVAAGVVFDDDLSDSDSDSDDELDEDPIEFQWNGATYWRTPGGHVMEEEDGPVIGRWDADEECVQFED